VPRRDDEHAPGAGLEPRAVTEFRDQVPRHCVADVRVLALRRRRIEPAVYVARIKAATRTRPSRSSTAPRIGVRARPSCPRLPTRR
jgi:hypothetical protein